MKKTIILLVLLALVVTGAADLRAQTIQDHPTVGESFSDASARQTKTPTPTQVAKPKRKTKTPSPTAQLTAVPTETATAIETVTPANKKTRRAARTATPAAKKTRRATRTPTAIPITAELVEGDGTLTTGLGMERYWTYQSFMLTDRVTLSVNVWNGNLLVQYNEFAISSRGPALGLTRTFNNQGTLTTNIGDNWTHTLRYRVAKNVADNTATLYDGDGTQLLFTNPTNGVYTSPAGIYDQLAQLGDGTFVLTHKDQSEQRFGLNQSNVWLPTQIQDRFGNTLTLAYDASNKLTTTTAAGGQSITFGYDAVTGKLTSATDNANHAFAYQYTAQNLTRITDPLNYQTLFGYTSNKLTSITDPRGKVTTIVYDTNNRVQTITVDGTPIAAFTYSTNAATFTDGNNRATAYQFNSTGQATSVTDAKNGVTTYTYDSSFNLLTLTDPLNHATTMTYDARGNLLTRKDALNKTTTYTYNSTNDLLTVTDARNNNTTYAYTAGKLASVTDPLNKITSYGYDSYAQRTSVTNARSKTTTYAYNSAGYLTGVTNALNKTTTYGYDAIGNRTSVTDARNNTTTYVYDTNNRLTEIHTPLNGNTTYAYDANGNRTSVTDALNHATTFTYDARNRQTSNVNALNQTTSYGYDANGNRTSVTDANNTTTNYTYDELNRLTKIKDPSNHKTRYSYDAASNRTTITTARNYTTTFTYDAVNRQTSVTNALNQTTSYQYDAVGNRTRVTDALNHATNYTYDKMNRVKTVTDTQNHVTTYTYDAVGNRTRITDATNQMTTYGYDAVDRLTSITNPSNKTRRFTYDAVGNQRTETDEQNQTTNFAYDARNRLTSKTDALNNTTTYAYDNVGNVLTITDPSNLVTTFVYDVINRVTSKTLPNGTTTYAYNNVNHLTTVMLPSNARRDYVYNNDNLVTSEARYDGSNTLLVTYGFAYDANHNLTGETETRPSQAAPTTTYVYDALDRRTSVTDPNNSTTTYTFDAAGALTGVTDPTGFSTTVTPNAVNLPATIVHRNESNAIVATTTNIYNNADQLTNWTTVDTPNALTFTNTLGYNGNGYINQANVSHTSPNSSPSLTSAQTYKDNNLLSTLTQSGWNDNHSIYDSADHLQCSEQNGVAREYLQYDGSGRREKRYFQLGSTSCATIDADLTAYLNTNWGFKRSTYTYEGNRLVNEVAEVCGNIVTFPCQYSGFYTRTHEYDADGNVTKMTKVAAGNTHVMEYAWEAGSQRLVSVTRKFNGNVNYSATLEYDRLNRLRKFCWNNTNDCHLFSYVGDSDWLSIVKDTGGTVLQRYLYANGRPLRVDIHYIWTLNPWYYRYNARGDASFVAKDGYYDGSTGWRQYGAWGDQNSTAAYKGYYNWNAAWGYMAFPKEFNFNLNDGLDVGLYYAHGRWYNQDTGLWLSPNEKGDYLYGGDGQDPVNIARDLQANKDQASSSCKGKWPAPVGMPSVAPLTEAQWFIAKREACRFGLPTELVAGTIAVEIVYDTDWIDTPLDFYLQEVPLFLHYTHPGGFSDVWLNDAADMFLEGYENYWGLFGGRGPGNGVSNVHILTAKKVEQYYAANYPGVDWLTQSSTYDRMAILLTDLGNTRYTAAILRQLADLRTNRKGDHTFDLTDTDMEI